MASVKANVTLNNVAADQIGRWLSQFLQELLTQINGGLEFKYNLKSSSLVTAVFITTNADLTVPHDLGRLPQGFIVVNATTAMRLYQGVQQWTNSHIVLRSDATGTAMLYVI